MDNYPAGSMKGSGIYSTDEEIAIDPCESCGGHDGILYTDDWSTQTLYCMDCRTEQPLPDNTPDWEQDADWGDES